MVVELMSEELNYLYFTPLEEIKGKQSISQNIIKQFKKKVNILRRIIVLSELNEIGSLNFEKLKGNLKDYYSIRLNNQYRIIFKIDDRIKDQIKIEVIQITEISKHYE
jgi:proteic killer suppression protein